MATIDEKKEKEKTYNINHFEEVGWIDPHCKDLTNYSGKTSIVNQKWDQLVYHPERYKPDHPPLMIYLPSKDLLEKMIKSTARGASGRPINNVEDILE
jgi:hypothetical protein